MTPLALTLLLAFAAPDQAAAEVSPNPTCYEPVSLTFRGPRADETDAVNPFRDRRLTVYVSRRPFAEWPEFGYDVQPLRGHFAADGDAAQTGASAGDRWRVRFLPQDEGNWHYAVSFREGPDAALSDDPQAGRPLPPDGLTGSFTVAPPDWDAPGFYADGPLFYGDDPYLVFMRSERRFLKAGADSPENLLAFADFDGTNPTHRYAPHERDWKEGDPTWRDGKGKGLIGALNYLASQGVNCVYFLTMNVAGDGKDVWPWTDKQTRDRFDVSKLDQWETVFTHADRLGIALHVVLTETENESLFEALDGPGAGTVPFADTRKLYYLELLSRFGHHPALFWNLGEENGGDENKNDVLGRANSTPQRLAFSAFLSQHGSLPHQIVVHTYPGQYDKIYGPLLGDDLPVPSARFEGASLQMGDPKQAHAETLKWLTRSREAGRAWFVCVDEIGPADTGVVPDDAPDAAENHRLAREVLWGNLLAGGSGVEWYFGYKHHDNDLNCEDFRSRAEVWQFTAAALEFFRDEVPFQKYVLESCDDLVPKGAFCLGNGRFRVAYLPPTAPAEMTLPDATFQVRWFDPAAGGAVQEGSVPTVQGGGRVPLGDPPAGFGSERVVLVTVER